MVKQISFVYLLVEYALISQPISETTMLRVFLILIFFTTFSEISNGLFIMKFKKVQCTSSKIHTQVLFCFIKTFKKRFSTMNIGVEVKKTSKELEVRKTAFI